MEVVAAGMSDVVGLLDSGSGTVLVTEMPSVVVLAGSVVGAFRSGITTVVNMLLVAGTEGSEETLVGTAGSEEVARAALVGTALASVVVDEAVTAALV